MRGLDRFLFKIALCGSGGVGKTSLYLQFLTHHYHLNPQMTMGFTIAAHYIDLPRGRVHLQIWDYGGQSSYRTLVAKCLDGVSGIMLLFDLTRFSSFTELEEWRQIVTTHVREPVPILLVGCKDDLCDQTLMGQAIAEDVIEEYLGQHEFLGYLRTSAKTGKNVALCFQTMAEHLLGPT